MTLDGFITLLIGTLVETIPAPADQAEVGRAANRALVRTMLEAFHPADPTEAAVAARAVAAHFAAMDSFARAAKPGVPDEKAVRLRANAIAAARVFNAAMPGRHRQRQPSGTDPRPHHPGRRTATPAPASQTRHRADLPAPLAGLAGASAQASPRSAWHSSTALTAAQPTVLSP